MQETKKFFTTDKIKDKFKSIYEDKFDANYPAIYIYFDKYTLMYESRYNTQDGVDDYKTWTEFDSKN